MTIYWWYSGVTSRHLLALHCFHHLSRSVRLYVVFTRSSCCFHNSHPQEGIKIRHYIVHVNLVPQRKKDVVYLILIFACKGTFKSFISNWIILVISRKSGRFYVFGKTLSSPLPGESCQINGAVSSDRTNIDLGLIN
jgi:hypothetical protein